MAGFHYRMQNILDISYQLERQAKIAFGLANRALSEEQEKLREVLLMREDCQRRLKEASTGKLDLKEIQRLKNAGEGIEDRIRLQMKKVQRAERDVERRRKELDERMQERKMHEKLREKALHAYRVDLEKKEERATDELVSYTHWNS